jgi:arginase
VLEIVGAPFDLCGPHHGTRCGPLALRLAGLIPQLEALVGQGQVRDLGDAVPLDGILPGKRDECDAAGLRTFRALREAVVGSLERGALPLVLGGDHSITLGSASAALAHHGEGLGVLWIDAHADYNAPDTTPSGNLHGMPLGVLTGREGKSPADKPWAADLDALWPQLLELCGPGRLRHDHIAWLGLRDVDEGEVWHMLDGPPGFVATMQGIDRDGLGNTMERLWEWAANSKVEHVWISFDVDVLDPVFAPGTGTAVRGGLTYREAHLVAEMLYEGFSASAGPRLAGVDVVEVNPLRDTANATAQVAIEWVLSLFGKTILHGAERQGLE